MEVALCFTITYKARRANILAASLLDTWRFQPFLIYVIEPIVSSSQNALQVTSFPATLRFLHIFILFYPHSSSPPLFLESSVHVCFMASIPRLLLVVLQIICLHHQTINPRKAEALLNSLFSIISPYSYGCL